MADIDWHFADTTDNSGFNQENFKIPAGFGCSNYIKDDNSIKQTRYSLQDIISAPMFSINLELDVYKIDSAADTKQFNPVSEMRSINILYKNSNDAGTGYDIVVLYDLNNKSNTKTVLDYTTQLKYKIDMANGLCERGRIHGKYSNDENLTINLNDKLVMKSTQFLGLFLEDEDFRLINRYNISGDIEIAEFEKIIADLDLGEVAGPASIVRTYTSINSEHSQSHMDEAQANHLSDVKITIFDKLKEHIQILMVAKVTNLERVSSESFMTEAIIENCFNIDRGQSKKISIRYFVQGDQLDKVKIFEESLLEQMRMVLMNEFHISPLQVSHIEMDLDVDGFLVHLTLLDRPRTIDFGELTPAHIISDELAFKGRKYLGVESLDSCSQWCLYYDCSLLSYCESDNYCIVLPYNSVYIDPRKSHYQSNPNCDSYEIERSYSDGIKDLLSLNNLIESICRKVSNFDEQPFLSMKINDKSISLTQINPVDCLESDESISQVLDHRQDLYEMDVHFQEFMHGHKLLKSDRKIMELIPSSYDLCKLACIENQCLIFSYCSEISQCLIQVNNLKLKLVEDISSLTEESPHCSIMQMEPLSLFDKYIWIDEPTDYDRLVLVNDEIECAQDCLGYIDKDPIDDIPKQSNQTKLGQKRCYSFDLCWHNAVSKPNDDSTWKKCYLNYQSKRVTFGPIKKKGQSDKETQEQNSDSKCLRYQRTILKDYEVYEHKSFNLESREFSGKVSILELHISDVDCSKVCNDNPACSAFASCFDETRRIDKCMIYEASNEGLRNKLINSDKCIVHILADNGRMNIHDNQSIIDDKRTDKTSGLDLSWFIALNVLFVLIGAVSALTFATFFRSGNMRKFRGECL